MISQNLRQRILRKLVRHPSLTKFVFFFYYSHIIKGAIATITPSGIENTTNGSLDNDIYTNRVNSRLLDSGAKVEKVRHIQIARRFTANLEKDFALPAYNPPLKIMPLGDSITSGLIGRNNRDSGGYRTELWQKLVADGLPVNFVGSQSRGPDSLSDKDHEGHPGWTIEQIAGSIKGWLEAAQPDFILLMIGTTDTRNRSIRTMINDLSTLIDQITTHLPTAQLLVASIPPIHPTAKPLVRVLRAKYFNTAIPFVVDSKVAQGKKVHFVDTKSLTVNDLTSSTSPGLDNGLHPNAQGYSKIANFWYDAVFRVISNRQGTLASR